MQNQIQGKIEAYLKEAKLYEKVTRICANSITVAKVNIIDDEMTYALNNAQKCAE